MTEPPQLPYEEADGTATAGWSGSDTSHERATREAADGTASARQRRALLHLRRFDSVGVTWRELADMEGWHHGQSSGVLSVLHKTGRIARLKERRQRSQVYVLPQYVGGRETAPYKPSTAKRDAWEEGYEAGHEDGKDGTFTDNPYE